MTASIAIEAKVVGRRKPVFADWRIELPPDMGAPGQGQGQGQGVTLRRLVERIVREEVRAFQERREQRRLPQVLSRAAIEATALAGKVDPGGRTEEQQGPDVDPEAAVATALQAFQDGVYYVFVDDVQRQDLDEAIPLRPDSRVTFLRLVALAGG